jgi:hypothetical protein
MKRAIVMLAALVLFGGMGGPASASSITYTITDIGTFGGYEDTNTSDTFSGTGFLGLYTSAAIGGSGGFGHLLGLENYGYLYSETALEVGIGALAGATITSATLSYDILDGDGGPATIQATSFSANGTLAYSIAPPSNLGTTTFISNQNPSSNSVDVTSLLQSQVTAGAPWFGLYLSPVGSSNQWTYTYSGFGANADSASVRLTVDYTGGNVPEPATITLLASGLFAVGGFGFYRRHRGASGSTLAC